MTLRLTLTRAAFIATVLAWCQPRSARAEDSVAYKYQDYRESGGRISVRAQYGLVEQDLGTDWHVKVQGVIDAIAGATPNGQPPSTPGGQVPLSQLTERRKAWSAEVANQQPRVNLAFGFANSRESDYVSNGWSLNTRTDFNQKNTTLLLGLAGTDDDVSIRYLRTIAKKRGLDFVAGVTQLLDPRTSVTLNLGLGRSTGYLGDPYRLVEQRTEILPGIVLPLDYPENRPDHRSKWTLLGSLNRAVPEWGGALDASYRLYHDTFGTTAHTVELAWLQSWGPRLTLVPTVRWYDQTAADFYVVSLTGAPFTPTYQLNPAGPFYSADYRLSAFRSYQYGLKAVVDLAANWQLDAALEKYEMHGRDHATSPYVYPTATIVTVGLKFSW
ncbi:MAG: DUF3570 domain-containing protein [Verrucomicrobia bacterium]|nr:DUF3570 domain-containing protein [Verrucomicrobiota bacterium]